MQPESHHPFVFHHMAVRLQDCIVLFGGHDKLHQKTSYVIYIYNIYTDQWKTCKADLLEGNTGLPNNLAKCCAVTIHSDIYVFNARKENTSALWKLRRNSKGSFSWSEVNVDQAPSWRYEMAGWEYAEKLWVFGGAGIDPAIVGHLNEFGDFDGSTYCNNQLLSFDPSCTKWSNLQCFGAVPSPQCHLVSAILGDKVWVSGGGLGPYDLHSLSMPNLTWTQIETKGLIPALAINSITAITDKKLAFQGPKTLENLAAIWILDVGDMSWKEYKASAVYDMVRFGATNTPGLYGSVITIGGSTIKQFCEPYCISLEPKCLQQLATAIIYKHKKMLPWKYLPHKLICKIMGTAQMEDIDEIRDGH